MIPSLEVVVIRPASRQISAEEGLRHARGADLLQPFLELRAFRQGAELLVVGPNEVEEEEIGLVDAVMKAGRDHALLGEDRLELHEAVSQGREVRCAQL